MFLMSKIQFLERFKFSNVFKQGFYFKNLFFFSILVDVIEQPQKCKATFGGEPHGKDKDWTTA